ncbi:general transcriptional corepressor TUP1 [Purpureocillium lavendulum]|uniref:General transcriptional corepressor TUP1 n=1 Tax=Purpureocillium lavendulum TaxID=1247861 RepID=A0AB34FCV7_9HYPO|nr:general transcriptional corepressor TUP1 [Purpureocillium lavendulum]
MTVSSDGQYIAVACGPFARVYDSRTGKEQRALKHSDNHQMSVLALRFSPDNMRLATGSQNGVIHVWNLEAGRIGCSFSHEGNVQAIDFPDDNIVVSGSSGDDMVRVWDVSGGINTRALDAYSPVTAVTTSQAGAYIAAGCEDGSVHIWDIATGILMAGPQKGHIGKVTSVNFSANGEVFISAGLDQTIRNWDSSTLRGIDNSISMSSKRVAALDGPHNHALPVAMMADGEQIVAGASDGSVRVFHTTGTKQRISKHDKPVISVATNSNGSPQGTVLASASTDGLIRVYPFLDDHLAKAVHSFPHSSPVCCVVFSHDGNYLAAGCSRLVKIFDVKSGEEVRVLDHKNAQDVTADNFVSCVAFSEDGGCLATGADDAWIRLWDTGSGILLKSLKGHTRGVLTLALSSDGRTMASCSQEKTVCLWDIEKGVITQTLPLRAEARTLAMSPNGQSIAVGSNDAKIHVWQVTSGSVETTLPSKDDHWDAVLKVAWTSKGEEILSASCDRTMKRWQRSNAGSWECVDTFRGHQDFVLSAAWTKDDEWILSGSKDRSVRLWDPRTGAEMLMVQAHKDSVISVAPSCQRGVFATGSADGEARIWFLEEAFPERLSCGSVDESKALSKSLQRIEAHEVHEDGDVQARYILCDRAVPTPPHPADPYDPPPDDERGELEAILDHKVHKSGRATWIKLQCLRASGKKRWESWEWEVEVQRTDNAAVLTYWYHVRRPRPQVTSRYFQIVGHVGEGAGLCFKVQWVGYTACRDITSGLVDVTLEPAKKVKDENGEECSRYANIHNLDIGLPG